MDGLKLHVEDESISVGDVLAVFEPKMSDSFAALIDNDRATLPGVIDGSSSIFLAPWKSKEKNLLKSKSLMIFYLSNSPSMVYQAGIREQDQ